MWCTKNKTKHLKTLVFFSDLFSIENDLLLVQISKCLSCEKNGFKIGHYCMITMSVKSCTAFKLHERKNIISARKREFPLPLLLGLQFPLHPKLPLSSNRFVFNTCNNNDLELFTYHKVA